jgi:hypothetical protein
MTTPAGEPNGKPEALDANPATSDTILTPPGTQYTVQQGARQRKETGLDMGDLQTRATPSHP